MSATTRATATKTTSLAATSRNTKSTPSLWDTANSKLDTKSRKSLASVNVGNGRVVDAVLKEAVTQQRALSAKRWKATIGGREVILRDVLAKIIRWVDHLKAVGDIAVQFNSGAASLPWAAVRFLLQVAVNDKQYLEATIEGIEMVTQKVATYAAMEDLYMDSDFQLHTQIRSKVLGLYVHILSFLAESIQYFKTNTPSRTAKGAFSTNQGERLRQIAKHDTEVRQLAKMCDSHVQRLIRTDVMRIDENIMTSLKAQSFRDFVAWLSLTPYREHHVRHSKHRLHGTNQWLTNDSRYVDWKSSASSSLLWLRGILGSGKTNLISAVIDDSLHSTNARSLVLYYYCSDIKGHGGRCDAKDVMRSLLRQLTVKNEETFEIVEQVHLEFRRREARGKVGMGDVDKLEPHECTHWIAQLLQTDEVVIIIDAIDEIDVTDRHLLLKELIALRDDPGRVTKMMLSSRDDTNLAQWLEGATELHLRTSLTQADMQHFISHCVSMAVENKYLLDGKVDPPFQSELESYFLHRADGMFRWVELQLRHFCDLKFKPSIEKAMSDTTGASTHTVNQLYATIFDGIFKTDPLAYSIAAQTFRLMLCLHETISPTALLAAASITRDGLQNSLELSDPLRICSHLVILDDELDTIRFAHASVQEYLLRHPEFSTMNANSAVASSCLTRCVDSLLPDLTLGVQPSRDFDVYAAMYWPLHYNAASEHDRDGYLRDALEEFMFSNQDFMSPFPSWIETVDEIVKILSGPHARLSDMIAVGSESATPFFTACIYGLEFAIEILSRTSSFDVDQKNARGNTGLYLASAAGQIRVVDVLLRLGADIAIEGGRHTTPLQAACDNGHGDIAQLIIDFSNQQITTGLMASAIQAALRNGYEDVAVILLKRNAVPMSQDTLDQVFEAAAGMGFAELMQYLHLTSKSLSGSKKLVIKGAVKIFHDTKLEWFRNYFQHKALPNDAVATAAFYGQNKIVELFLDKGLDIEQEGPFGTPLRAASLMGHGTTVRLLLNRDAMMNENGPFGDALQAAAMRGHLSITTMLIQSGVAVDNSGGYYGNALQAATYRGHIDVVKALLAAGASIGQKGLSSDALSAAVSAGNQPITNLLLQSGYRSPHLVDEDEIVMLSAARHRMSSTSHVDLLSALDSTHHSKRTRQADPANTRKGRDFSFEEAYKRLHEDIEMEGVMGREDHEHYKQYESNALLVATVTGQESVVRSMLDYRSAIGLSLSDIGVALKVASAAGQLDIVDHILLLPDLPEQCIPRALERAAWYGHVAVMKRLLQCEEAYGPPPDSGYTPFTPREDTRYKRVHSDKKKTRWSDYFPLSYEAVDTNETAETSHIMRILLLGCRGNAPATVELALQLAAESVLQDLFATALAITIGSNSELALEVLLRHHPTIEATMLKEACTQAEKEESLRVLYVLLQHNSDHGYRVQDYWNVYNGADRTKHSSLISYLDTQTLNWQDDSVFAQTFVEAAQRGYVSALKSWERRLFQLFNYDLLMSRALDQTCANGHAVVASYLIELGADVNTIIEKPMESSGPIKHRRVPRRSYGTDKIQVWPRTALQACLQATPQYDRVQGIPIYSLKEFKDRKQNFLNKQQEVIQLLLRKKADANFVDSHGRSALHYAALYCSVETVRTILESGAAVDILDKDDKTPLFYAAWRELDSFAVLKVLTKAEEQARPSATRTSPALLLDAALSVFKNGFVESESVRQVLTTGSGAVIRYLLQSQTDLQATATGFPLLLQMASADGDFELVRLLIERIVDVKAVCHCYGTALHAAARFGHLDCVKLLVEVGTEIALAAGNFRWTPLRAAVEGQHLAIVQFLLDSGAMQSCSDFTNQGLARYSRRDSTLTSACRSGSVDLVKLLLSYSEQPTLMPGQKGIRRTQFVDMASALQGACENGHVEIVALLIEYGADIEQEYGRFSSPLTAAAAAGDLETMKVLLAAGATLYDAERAINILRTLVVRGKPKDTIDYVLTRLLHTDDFIYACREIPAYVRAWQEDAKFVLHVQTMQSSDRLLANLAALGAQRSIELLMESSIDMAEVRPAMLQAAAYFQSYNILFELLPMVVIPQPLPLIYQSPAYAMLAGFMPIQLKTDSIHKNLCCEAWATNSFLYSWIPGRLDKECACSNARTAASEAILKLAQIDGSHICASAGILHLASYLGMLQVVQLCLDLGVKIDQRHESFGSALIAGIEGDSFDVVVMLLQRHIDVNTTSDDIGTPLYPTRQTRNMAGRRFVDYKTPGTGTALHRVCQNKDLAMAELLLQHGAEVNVLIPGKGTSMHVACEKKDEKLLKLLLRYGADVDIVSPDLGSALHVTCKSHSAGLAEILLQHGANVNVFSSNHGIPLHAACADKGDDATIQLLLKHGADVNSKGSNGDSVLTSILSRRICSFERSLGSLLGTEQQLKATGSDLDRSMAEFVYSKSEIQICKRVLADNKHLEPTIEMVRSALARSKYLDSDILRLLLARVPHLNITLEMVKNAQDLESFELLTKHGSGIEIMLDLMRSFLDPLELNLIKYSVQSAPEIRPPPAVVTRIRAILDQPETEATGTVYEDELTFRRYPRNNQKPIAKEIMGLILVRYPDIEVLHTTNETNESHQSDTEK